MELWQNNICHLYTFLRGWDRNQSCAYKKEKQRLLDLIDKLDITTEMSPLTAYERGEMKRKTRKWQSCIVTKSPNGCKEQKIKHIQEGVATLNILNMWLMVA
jgi:hypothetical protein